MSLCTAAISGNIILVPQFEVKSLQLVWRSGNRGFNPWVPDTQTWWRHQMGTFSVLLALCEGNTPVTGGFPSQRPATRSFDVFFDLRLNERVSKQSRRRWFETPSRSSWRHCNEELQKLVNMTRSTTAMADKQYGWSHWSVKLRRLHRRPPPENTVNQLCSVVS